MSDLIAETLERHQATMVHEAGPDIALACECDDTYRTYAQHAAHQAEAVREALLGDEAVERVERALDEHRMVSDEWDLETVAESVLAALIGGDRDAV